MKYNEFKISDLLVFAIPDSEFMNRKMLVKQQRSYLYFENYFMNRDIQVNLYQLPTTTDMIDDFKITMEKIMERFDVFSDYIYDEKTANYYQYNDCIDDVSLNKTLFRFINSCQLFSAYFAKKIKGCPGRYADELFTGVFYFLVNHYNVHDSLDKVIYWKGRSYPKKERNYSDDEYNMTVRDWKSQNLNETDEFKEDFDFNKEKEICLIKTILSSQFSVPSASNIISCLGNEYNELLDGDIIGRGFIIQKGKGMIYEKLKSLLVEINLVEDDEYEDKDNIINKINALLNDNEFDDIREYNQLKSTLNYGYGSRPVFECEELMKKYKDDKDYRFKGIVYHGYRDDNNGSLDPVRVLSRYENGYISCSKDVNQALNFTHNFRSGSIIEIFIDDNIDAIDISKLLEDNYKKSTNKYKDLYKSFINEQEVLVKMPISKFRYLTPDQVRDIQNKKDTSDHQLLQTYKPMEIK